MGGLYENDVLARDGAEQADVPLAVRKAAGVPLEGDVDMRGGELAGDPFREGDGRGTADDLDDRTDSSYGAELFESSYLSRSR